jgi:hypothetical protein
MMGHMSSDQRAAVNDPSAQTRAPSVAPSVAPSADGVAAPDGSHSTVEWGGGDDRTASRRNPVPAFLARLVGDRRLVPLAAASGGVALFASLISEWQITGIDGPTLGSEEVGARPFQTGIAELGAWGGGYLAGLFVLVAGIVLMLFGPPAGRVYARLVTLSTGGVMLGLLAAILSDLQDNSRVLNGIWAIQVEESRFTITSGRGGYCAVAGVLAVSLAALLAGRHLPPAGAMTRGGSAAGPGTGAPANAGASGAAGGATYPVDDWSWRRPGNGGDDDAPDVPYELTVSSADPFTSPVDVRDTYRRPDGISG